MNLKFLVPLLAGVAWLPAAAALSQTASPVGETPSSNGAPAGRSGGLGEIVVTAQRRSENIQRVPVAVTAIGAAQLEQLRAVSVKSLAGVAPGLQVLNQGLASNPDITIRGISSGVSNNAVDPKVGVYLDGVYIGRTVGSVFDLADIQRVEVLRGPQGTLFGRNATAGAVSLTTAAPTGQFRVRGNLSYGNYDAKRGKVVVDLPKIGPFSVKVAYLHDDIDGDYRNTIGGQTIDLTPRDPSFGTLRYAKKLGMSNTDGGQVAVRGEFGNLTADYRFDYTDQKASGRAIQNFGRLPDGSQVLLDPIDALQALTGGTSNISSSRLKEVANATSVEHVVTQGHSLTLSLQATDSLVIKSISSYRKFRQDPNIYDLGATGGERFSLAQLQSLLAGDTAGIFNPANQPGPGDSFFSLLTSRKTSQSQVTQELQFQITRPRWNFTGGIFLFHERSPATDVLGIFDPTQNGAITANQPANPLFPAVGANNLDAIFGSGVTRSTAINNSFAGYGQLTIHVTDKIDVAGGVRGTIDDRRTHIYQISTGQGGDLGPGRYNVTYRKATYTGIVTYRPTSEINAYAKVATGYVAGGILSGIPYRPESLTSYELGLKAQFFDNRLRANIALFYQKYKDLQIQDFANGVQFFSNAGKANIKGIEAEVEATPIHGILLTGNISYNKFDYKEYFSQAYKNADGVEYNIAATARNPYVSDWTARATAQYDAPAFSNGSHLYFRVEGNYRSHYFLTGSPYTLSGNPTVGPDAPVEAFNRQPGYWLVNGNIGLADIKIGGSTFSLSGFGNNLFNKQYVGFGAPVEGLTATYERGRTYGLELSFDFK